MTPDELYVVSEPLLQLYEAKMHRPLKEFRSRKYPDAINSVLNRIDFWINDHALCADAKGERITIPNKLWDEFMNSLRNPAQIADNEHRDDRLFRIERLAYEAELNHPECIGYVREIKEIAKELRGSKGGKE